MTMAALPASSHELVDVYLKAAAISALHVWVAHGAMVRLEAIETPARSIAPRGIKLASTVWAPGRSSVRLKAAVTDELKLSPAVWSGQWVAVSPELAAVTIRRIAGMIGVAIVDHATAKDRAAVEVAKVEAVFQQRRETGDLRPIARDYRSLRESNPGMRRFPTWGSYVRELRGLAVEEAARKDGAAVIMGRGKAP